MDKQAENNTLIWKNFLAGDKEAFAHLYNQHVQTLFRYGTKLCPDESLVKDAIQEVFLDLYLKRKNNKTNPQNLKYYLILALKRNLIKQIKRNRKLLEETACEGQFEPEYSIERSIVHDEEEAELNRRVGAMLNELPAKQKEALYLRFNESMEYPEIAKLLEISVESVRKQVYRALTTIRKKFGQQGFVLWLVTSGVWLKH